MIKTQYKIKLETLVGFVMDGVNKKYNWLNLSVAHKTLIHFLFILILKIIILATMGNKTDNN